MDDFIFLKNYFKNTLFAGGMIYLGKPNPLKMWMEIHGTKNAVRLEKTGSSNLAVPSGNVFFRNLRRHPKLFLPRRTYVCNQK